MVVFACSACAGMLACLPDQGESLPHMGVNIFSTLLNQEESSGLKNDLEREWEREFIEMATHRCFCEEF